MTDYTKDWICPVCGKQADPRSRCRCARHDSECIAGHKFHTCTVHDRQVPGQSDHSQNGCTCRGNYKNDALMRLRACFNFAWLGWENVDGRNKKEQIRRMGGLLKRIAMMATRGMVHEDDPEGQVHTHVGGFIPPRPEVPTHPPDLEILASAHHESWAGWTRYMLGQMETQIREWQQDYREHPGRPPDFATVLSSLPCVERWTRQMSTAYEDLPEEEKASDRTEVGKHIVDYRPWYFDEADADKLRAQRRLDSGIPAKGEPNAR